MCVMRSLIKMAPFRNSVFYNVLGGDFVSIAFKAARAADLNTKLYINDYKCATSYGAKLGGVFRCKNKY